MTGAARVPCRCRCRCGASRDASTAACVLCAQGLHHRCSRSCRGYDITRLDNGLTLGPIPPRKACDGGRAAVAA